jgi:hypothetical protein
MKPYNVLQAVLSLISSYKDFIHEVFIRGLEGLIWPYRA